MAFKLPSGCRWLEFRRSLLFRAVIACFSVVFASDVRAETILISELMYRPASENVHEEYVELYNPGGAAVRLANWRFSTGVRFTFPDITLPPGGYLVVAADVATFSAIHPGASNVVGGWEGILSNSGQLLELVDSHGQRVDSIRYADSGDWASRERALLDYGHRGLTWSSPADGGGHSLELVNLAMPNKHGQNWLPSAAAGGTPGAPNSVASTNLAPLILDAGHFPILPKSTGPVIVTARVLDESVAGVTAALHYRVDGAPLFTETPMFDDGQHNDGLAADGVFGASVPAQPNNTIIEFYLSARDAGGNIRTYPAPVNEDGHPAQVANLLYQVDDAVHSGAMPLYRLIMKASDLTELRGINASASRSHAEFNATFVSTDGQGTQVRYLAAVRNRGNGSRGKSPQSLRVNFRSDDLWKGVSAINLNSQYTHAQLFGSALYRRAGLPAQSSRPALVQVNGASLATSGAPSYGFYACNEVLSSEFAAHVFPLDSSGNIYRGIRLTDVVDSTANPPINSQGADLHYLGSNTNLYRENYFKQSNTSEDDWSDLMELTRVLEHEPSATYADAVRKNVNVEEWMLYFAVETLVDNKETNLANGNNGTGEGDDYFLYSGKSDRRFNLIPYDLDTILGQGDTPGSAQDSLWRMNANSVVARFMKHPDFAPVYFRTLRQLADSVFAPEQIGPLADQTLKGLVPESGINQIKAFAAERRAGVLAQIPWQLAVTNSPPLLNGLPHTTAATAALSGQADAVRTRQVRVNGQPAVWTAWTASWTAADVILRPGVNLVLVQAFDEAGAEFDRATVAIWRDNGAPIPKSGTLTGDVTWTAAAGPYLITSSLTVAPGAKLNIEAGATVYLAGNADFTVAAGGALNVAGTDANRVLFTRQPGGADWGGMIVKGAASIAYTHFEFNSATAIHADGGDVTLDHLTFGNPTRQYLSLDGSSFVIKHCHFPSPTAALEPLHGTAGIKVGGQGILRDSFIGAPNGYNDAFDFTGGSRPGPILQVINNVFAGSGDDLLDLDGTDAWIEGNIFLHCHKNGAPDSSSAVSGGNNGGATSRITVINNLFFDCDHAATAKQGNFYALLNNTIVRTTKAGGTDIESAVVNMQDAIPAPPTTYGAGCYLQGNVVLDTESLVRNYDAAQSIVTFTNNWLPTAWSGPGGGNLVGAPRVRYVPTLAETSFSDHASAQVMWNWLSVATGSPEFGAHPRGVVLAGEPAGVTRATSATLRVGPFINPGLPWAGGFTHYRWRLDGGAWSGEIAATEPIVLTDLADGPHFVEAVGRNDAGVFQDSALLGDAPQITRSRTWVVDRNRARLVLNEVLARNLSFPHEGSLPDMVELFNDSAVPADLGGMGLTTVATNQFNFVFPAGTTIPAEGYLVVLADDATNTSGLHLGFALKQSGDALYLFDAAGRGGQLLDSVRFGPQIADHSIGRLADDSWGLTQPSFGAPNVLQPTADVGALRINEWLAATGAIFRDDFVELYNPDPLPAPLAGLFLTDHPISPENAAGIQPSGTPGVVLPPLSFVAGNGFTAFLADGDASKGGDHLALRLAAEQGVISLAQVATPEQAAASGFALVTNVIDSVMYGPQQPDVSLGRSPNGAAAFVSFDQPSPGGANPGSSTDFQTTTVTLPLLALGHSWKYWQTGDAGTAWREPDFDDAPWPAGAAPLGRDSDTLPIAFKTPLTIGKMTYYFRTHFNFPTNATGWRLRLQTYVDDGAMFWLNGQPLHRQNFSATPVYASHADVNIDNAALEGPVDVLTADLREGDNVLAVEVHQQNSGSGDIVFAARVDAAITVTNVVSTDRLPVRLNEILASNVSFTNAAGFAPDWIELFNPAATPMDLTDCSLSNDPAEPRKYVFPPGASVPARGFLLIECEGRLPASGTNTGFDLDSNGGGIYLYDSQAHASAPVDSVRYGLQAHDFSIGRVSNGAGSWQINLPTPVGANSAAATGNASFLKVNEWMANPVSGDDWFELFNPASQPVELGGLFLTDVLNDRTQHAIAPLSFIGAGTNGFAKFVADGNAGRGANHVSFRLSASGEAIGLFAPSGQMIDGVPFLVQELGVSEGRSPDGAARISRFPGQATPGASNASTGVADSDLDGLPDDWERAFGLDPFNPADATQDADGDGLSNAQEFAAGTRPNDADSRLALELVTGQTGWRLRFDGVMNRSYRLEVRGALGAGAWQNAGDFGPLTADGTVSAPLPGPLDSPQRFYRLVVLSQRP